MLSLIVLFSMESSVANVYETFIAQHITRWDQVSDLIAALAKKFPACKYPRTNRDSNNRVLMMLESFMNVASGNRPKEILVDLLNGRTRKKLRKQINKALFFNHRQPQGDDQPMLGARATEHHFCRSNEI